MIKLKQDVAARLRHDGSKIVMEEGPVGEANKRVGGQFRILRAGLESR